jgi:hypothetical protein
VIKKVVYLSCLLAASVPFAQATPIFGCTAGAECNGNEYAVFEVSHLGSTYVLELDIKVTNSYTGNLTDSINAVALKNMISSYTSPVLISAPGTLSDWTFVGLGLNAGGCKDQGETGLCAETTSGAGWPLFSSGTPVGILAWQFQFDSPDELDTTAHIKYQYVDSNGDKVGSLGSWDIGIQCLDGECGSAPPAEVVPEPVTMLLTGAGLVGIYFIGRRRRRTAPKA